MSRNFASDQSLIDSLRSNDTEAFEELFRRYWHNLYIYSLKKLHSSDQSRHIVREIFKDLWEKRHTFPIDFSLSQHLYAEVRKSVVRHLNESLTADIDDAIIRDQILPGFSVNSLQQSKLPVIQKQVMKPQGTADANQAPRKLHSYSNLVNIKWLLNMVSTRMN